MPLQMSAAMIFIPIARRTHPAEIVPTPKQRKTEDSKILIAFPGRAFQEVLKTLLFFNKAGYTA